jgi:predicted ABC-type sugar transport system permease subunit
VVFRPGEGTFLGELLMRLPSNGMTLVGVNPCWEKERGNMETG